MVRQSRFTYNASEFNIIHFVLGKSGADRENTTVMAAVSTAGQKLPPMIVFEEMHVQTTWRPNVPRDSSNYPWLYANKSGRMDSETFYKWFEEWEVKTRSYKDDQLEARLLLYDGHLSHIWYGTIELARTQNVTIIKLPPHTTDLLQPLDVSVLKALKGYWGDILFKRLRTTRSRLTKAEFATHLCDPEVWEKAFSKENVINGFKGCGICPVDRKQYPVNRFNVNLKARYDKWIEEGKPDISAEEIDQMLSTAKKNEAEDSQKEDQLSVPSTSSPSTVTIDGKKGKIVSYFVLDDDPSEMTRINNPSPYQNVTPTSSMSFKDIALKKIDDLQTPKTSKPSEEKRKRINPFSELVTSDKKFQEIFDEEQQKEKAKKEKIERKKEKEKKSKQKEKQKPSRKKKSDDDSEVDAGEILEEDENEFDESSDDERKPEQEEICLFPPKNDNDAYQYLVTVWDELKPPVEEKSLQGKVVGVIYEDAKNKPHLFIGKIQNRFLLDEHGPAKEFTVEVFKKAQHLLLQS